MIRKVLNEGLFHEDYVRLHTNASFLVEEGYGFENGLFAGLRPGPRCLRPDGVGVRARVPTASCAGT